MQPWQITMLSRCQLPKHAHASPGSQKRTLWAIATYGEHCYASVAALARRTGYWDDPLSARQIRYALAALREHGLLTETPTHGRRTLTRTINWRRLAQYTQPTPATVAAPPNGTLQPLQPDAATVAAEDNRENLHEYTSLNEISDVIERATGCRQLAAQYTADYAAGLITADRIYAAINYARQRPRSYAAAAFAAIMRMTHEPIRTPADTRRPARPLPR